MAMFAAVAVTANSESRTIDNANQNLLSLTDHGYNSIDEAANKENDSLYHSLGTLPSMNSKPKQKPNRIRSVSLSISQTKQKLKQFSFGKQRNKKYKQKNSTIWTRIISYEFRRECPLLSIFVLYTLLIVVCSFLGGIIFHVCEYEFENTQILQKRELYRQIANNLDPQYIDSLDRLLEMCDIPYDLNKNRWGVEKATFFAFTTASTIGYGYTTPHTEWGQLCTFLYGLPAIILFGLSMVQIGHALVNKIDGGPSKIVRFLFYPLYCYKCNCIGHELKRTLLIFVMLLSLIAFSSWLLTQTEDTWTIYNAAYFIWISISTIGYGDLEPDAVQSSYWANALIWIGLAMTAIFIGSSQDYVNKKVQKWKNEDEIRENLNLFSKKIDKKRNEMMLKRLEMIKNNKNTETVTRTKKGTDDSLKLKNETQNDNDSNDCSINHDKNNQQNQTKDTQSMDQT